jgi:NAD(P)-dependent dehydrogenase (short-subunit alcohol dehydrogenase family)
MTGLDFTGKVAIVTGAGGGIGQAVSLALAEQGARVVAVDFDAESGAQTALRVRELGGESLYVRADVRIAQDVAGYVAEARAAFGGRIDVFINNAGWQGMVAPLCDYADDAFDQVIAVNVRGVYLGLKHVLPVMMSQGAGAVVITGSLASYAGTRNLAPYTASKHAVLGLMKSAALEVARSGVRVNAVCPGPVNTAMIREIEAKQAPGEALALRKKRTASIPDGRYADPEEVANLMIYLASDLASHITGQGVQINGGANF